MASLPTEKEKSSKEEIPLPNTDHFSSDPLDEGVIHSPILKQLNPEDLDVSFHIFLPDSDLARIPVSILPKHVPSDTLDSDHAHSGPSSIQLTPMNKLCLRLSGARCQWCLWA